MRAKLLGCWFIVTLFAAGTLGAAGADLRLIEAVRNQDREAVRALLKQKVDVKATQPDGATALHWAAYRNDQETADLLLRAGASVNAQNELGATPLWLASVNGNAAMIDRLLKAGANPNVSLLEGETPLMTAARTGNVEVVKLLLANGANVNARERSRNQTALMWATTQQHTEVVRALVENGADVAARSEVRSRRINTGGQGGGGADDRYNPPGVRNEEQGGYTPLLFAAQQGVVETAKVLLDAGADVNDTAPNGASVLVVAAHSGHGPLAAFLLDKGADPNAAGAGYTALHAAILRADGDLVKALLAHGADPNVPVMKGTPVRRASTDWALNSTWIGGTSFWLAAKFADAAMMRRLAAGGANPLTGMEDGTTPLIAAIGTGLGDRRARGVGNNVPVDDPDAERGVLEAVTVAVELGGDVNAATTNGDTPLHSAASAGLASVVQFLADKGAKLDAKNKRGQTPLAAALARRPTQGGNNADADRKSTVDLLRKLGAPESPPALLAAADRSRAARGWSQPPMRSGRDAAATRPGGRWHPAGAGLALLAVTAAWSLPAAARRLEQAPLTFTRDIAPIVLEHCAPCHRPGEIAPFSLLTYSDVRGRARLIVEVTRSRYMPPWKPARGAGEPFVGERGLTEQQISAIASWVDQGAVEGDPTELPAMPSWPEGWRLGTPDLVVTMAEPYTLPADGPDLFRNFVLPIPIGETKYVAAIEFRPNSRVAHHANLRIDRTRSSRERDAEDPLPGYEGAISPSAQYPDGHFLGWTPGQLTPRAAKGMAWRLEPGSDFVIQVHMQPAGRPESVRASVGLFFADDPPERTPVMLRLGRQRIDIAAGESRYVTQDRYTLPVDVHVYGLQPHAHFRAKEVKGLATLPDGTTRWLIHIPSWDFNWQDVYRFAEPVFLPAGTTVSLEWIYDNSADNPRNPDRPPRRVLYGQNSTDEMGDLWLQVLPRTPQERARLFEDFRPKLLAEDAAGYETMLLADPQNAKLHDYVALVYWDLGQIDRAIGHYEAAVRLDPEDARTRYNFATLLVQGGRLDEADAQLRRVLALEPNDAAAHNNLAAVLLSQSRFEEAVQHFSEALHLEPQSAIRRSNLGRALVLGGRVGAGIGHLREAIRIDPDLGDAHFNLAQALAGLGQLTDAIQGYRAALRVSPDWPPALSNLALLLATTVDPRLAQPDEAIRLAERAVALTGRRDIEALEALAAAYAASRRFDEAIDAAEAAVALAVSTSTSETVDRLRSHLESYRRRMPAPR